MPRGGECLSGVTQSFIALRYMSNQDVSKTPREEVRDLVASTTHQWWKQGPGSPCEATCSSPATLGKMTRPSKFQSYLDKMGKLAYLPTGHMMGTKAHGVLERVAQGFGKRSIF